MSRLTAFSLVGSIVSSLVIVGCVRVDTTSQSEESSSSAKSQVQEDAVVTATFTLEQVALHATEQDCFTTIEGGVYDLTSFVSEHKGGADKILDLCGKDGTGVFTRKHGTFQPAIDTLAGFRIGTVQ